MNLQVDQKVVCINDRFPIQVLKWGSNLPKRGSVYTISDIKIVDAYQGPRGPALLLAELKNPGDRLWFHPKRFVVLEYSSRQQVAADAVTSCEPKVFSIL